MRQWHTKSREREKINREKKTSTADQTRRKAKKPHSNQ
jgi:hypothetical protein